MKSKLLFTLLFTFSITVIVAQDTITSLQDTIIIPQDTVTIDDEEKDYVYMDIELSDAEKAKVDYLISKISPDGIEEFENKYNLWFESSKAPELQIHSNPEMYKTEEFYDFKNFTLSLGFEYIGLLIDFYQDNHSGLSHYILMDITFEDYGYLLDEARTEIHTPQYTEDGKKIYYSINYSFANLYFKKILSQFEFNGNNLVVTSTDQVDASKKTNFMLFPNPVKNKLNLQFVLSKPEHVSIRIMDILGNEVEIINKNKFYAEGQYSISWQKNNNVTNGIYLINFETKDSKLIDKFIVKE